MSGRAHEAGAIHGDFGHRGPAWLRTPIDVNALMASMWPQTVHQGANGVLNVGGIPVSELAREYGTPVYLLDEEDFRARCRAFKAAFRDAEVFYAGKAFLCKAIVRMLIEEEIGRASCREGVE